MTKFLSYKRLAFFACAVVALVAAYFLLGRQAQPVKAQDRPSHFDGMAVYKKFAVRDAVTDSIRSSAKELVRVKVNSEADRSVAAGYGTLVQDLGSYIVIAKNKGASLNSSGLDNQKIDETIHLPGANFDPIKAPPTGSVAEGAQLLPEGNGYYVVQFGGIATDEWLTSIQQAGVEVLQYVPNNAFFVYGSGEALSRVAQHSRVRWVGRYEPEQRMPAGLREQLAAAKTRSAARSIESIQQTGADTAIFDIAVFSRADLLQARKRILELGGGSSARMIRLQSNFFNIVRAELPIDKVDELSQIADVVRIDSWVKPQKEDERAAQIVAGNYTGTTTIAAPGYDPLMQFGVDGTNVTVSVADDGIGIPGDGGFYVTANNAVNGPLRGASVGASGHGHLNASIIAGDAPYSSLDPTGYNYGKGIAPKAHLINIPILLGGYSGTEADIYNDTVTTAGPNLVMGSISNNSWGAGTNSNAYDSYAASFDGYVRDASFGSTIDPVSIIFSAGNSGSSGLTRPKVAKNVISVGNSENLRTELSSTANNMDDLSGSSSRGPAADGRIKPDITAPGTAITGSRSGPDTLFGNVDQYVRWSTGTSHAAPQVAGAAALFTQHWKIYHMGQNPSPAMIKAAILNTGQEMNGVGTNGAAVPNGNEGWGRINMKYMIDRAAMVKQVDQSVPLSDPGQSWSISGTVSDPSRPVRVTLVWTDPPAAADPALVNNLDLEVTVGGTTYRGNVFTLGVSVAGGTADTKNNVEQVWLPAGLATGTPFTVKVTAAALNGDGILGNADTTDQNFALVAYNMSESQAPTFVTVAGQAVSQGGRGVPNAVVKIVGQDGIPRFAVTNPFGYFRFSDVATGQDCIITIASKNYVFAARSLPVTESLGFVTMTSTSGAP